MARILYTDPILICSSCCKYANALDWRCSSCGRHLDIENLPIFDPTLIDEKQWSILRYKSLLPVPINLTLGEGGTPLIEIHLSDLSFWAKLEFVAPTGSCKDRGSVMLINYLRTQSVKVVVEDSSGNAGASLAAYSSAAGLQSRIFVPLHTAQVKKDQMVMMGAEVVEVPGDRTASTTACLQAINHETVYASHAWNPFYLAGIMSCAWEIWEQLDRRAPDLIVCPVGQGNLLLGIWNGFKALKDVGLINSLPRIIGVQSEACAPIVEAWRHGKDQPVKVIEQMTIAEGLRVATPIHGKEILEAIRSSNGEAITVDDNTILETRLALACQGIFVELSSAVAVAGLIKLKAKVSRDQIVVVPLTGSGLKGL